MTEWQRVRTTRVGFRLRSQAIAIAHQIISGTLPAEGCIVCPDSASARRLLSLIRDEVTRLEQLTKDMKS